MTVKLITEQVQDVQILKEEDEKTGKKNYKLKGIFLQGDIKNRNGRVYPVEVLEKEVKRYNNEYVKTNRAMGELGHPDGPQLNLERVSHLIKELQSVEVVVSVFIYLQLRINHQKGYHLVRY